MGRFEKVLLQSKYVGALLFFLATMADTAHPAALVNDKADAPKVAEPRYFGINSIEKMRPEGEFEIHLRRGQEWVKAGSLFFDRFLREREIDLGHLLHGEEEVRIKISQKGGTAAHLDAALLGSVAPHEVKGLAEELVLYKLSKKDLDVVDAYDRTLEMSFPKGDEAKLRLTARIEGPIRNSIPFQFPRHNLTTEVQALSSFYTYQIDVPGKNQEPRLIFREFSPTSSGHPSGFTYAWVSHDAENLYVKIDFTPDNTSDGDKDYAEVFVKTGTGIKKFKVTADNTRWGRPYFTYTDKVSYRHKVYEFTLPLEELGIAGGDQGGNIQLAFSVYGTAGWGNTAPVIAYDSRNNRYLLVYLKENFEGIGVYGRILNCDGSAFTEEFVISSEPNHLYGLAVAYDNSNERFFVVFCPYVSGTTYDIVGRLVNSDGIVSDASFTISNAFFGQINPAVSYDGVNQRFLVVWQDYRSYLYYEIYGQLVDASDLSLVNGNFPIAQGNGDKESVAVAYDWENGRYLVVWADRQSNWGIYGQLVNSNGSLHGSPFSISTAGELRFEPSVSYDGTNQRFLVAFAAYETITDWDIYAQLIEADGRPYGPTILVSRAVGEQVHPAVAFDNLNQRFLIVWQDFRNIDYDIYGQYVSAAGVASGSNFTITEAADHQYHPKLASNSNFGNFLVVFETVVSGEITIFDLATVLVGPPCERFTLWIGKAGTGSGTVTSLPSGISCGFDCAEEYAAGTEVSLTATPDSGSIFKYWNGDCSGSGPTATVTMDANKTCTAAFMLTSWADLTGNWVRLTQRCKDTPLGIKCKLTGSLRIENQGNLRAAFGALVRFYLSSDSSWDWGDLFLKQVSLGAVKPGKSKKKKLRVSLPIGESASGKYVIAWIDGTDIVQEGDEDNNFVASDQIP